MKRAIFGILCVGLFLIVLGCEESKKSAEPPKKAGWATYTISNFSIAFDYPEAKKITATIDKKTAFVTIDEEHSGYIFVKKPDQLVEYPFDNLSETERKDLEAKESKAIVDTLDKVYQQRSVKDVKPYSQYFEAELSAASAPEYVESFDGNFRGFLYFAYHSQDYGVGPIACFIVMYDKKDVVTVQVGGDLNEYYKEDAKVEDFYKAVGALTTKSDEEIAKEVVKVYIPIAQSLRRK